MPIEFMSVEHYTAAFKHAAITFDNPPWEVIERELRTMDSWAKPNLFLQQNRDINDSNLLGVCGGSGIYHIQVADEKGNWQQAFDPGGSDEVVEVWRSDQGFSTEAKNTWSVERAVELVRWYVERGTRYPGCSWA